MKVYQGHFPYPCVNINVIIEVIHKLSLQITTLGVSCKESDSAHKCFASTGNKISELSLYLFEAKSKRG